MPKPATRRAFVLALASCFIGGAADAERIYRYFDEDGVVVYSNIHPGKARRGLSMKEDGEVVRVVSPRAAASFVPKAIPPEYLGWLEEACRLYRIPVPLARAVMTAESNHNPKALSSAGAQGLMQLMPGTAAEMFVDDAFDPKQNIFGGVRYLRVLANLFEGDMVRMIASYNAGPAAVQRAGGIPEIAETQEYVRRVLRLYYSYKKEASGAGSVAPEAPKDERGSNDG